MNTRSRRRFLKEAGGAAALMAAPALAQQISEFSVIEADLEFEIRHGRRNPIHIRQMTGQRPLPVSSPSPTEVDFGNVIFRVNMHFDNAGHAPNYLQLWLFEPRPDATVASLDTPPTYPGHGTAGNFTLRYPAGDNTFVRIEDSALWQDYIDPFWTLVPGAHNTTDRRPDEEANNSIWPGERAVHNYDTGSPPPSIYPIEVPLRVSRTGVSIDGQRFLLVVAIRRFGRLRLLARPVFVDPIIGQTDIDISRCPLSIAFMGGGETDLASLRRWRDHWQGRTGLGRRWVGIYYRLAPKLAPLARRSRVLRGLLRLSARTYLRLAPTPPL